tara:strand:- start:391 stop:600 length:210 start_codon:yes stop_codon:yes gene_type:complete
MLECPLCKDWLYVNRLCEKCIPIKNIVALVGIEAVAEVLNDIFLRTDNGIKEKTHRTIKTRSSKKEEEE